MRMGVQGAVPPAGARGALALSFFLKEGRRADEIILSGCQECGLKSYVREELKDEKEMIYEEGA